MGFLNDLLGGGSPGQQNSTTTQALTKQDQTAKDTVFNAALDQFKTSQGAGFSGAKPVGPSADTTAAQTAMRTAANGALTTQANNVANASQFGLADVLNIADNPYLANAKAQSAKALTDQFTQAGGVLSNIRSDALSNGTYGGSRQGIAEGLAMQGLAKAIAGGNAQLDSSAYANGLNTFNQTINSLPTLTNAQLAPAATLSNVGANTEGYAQQQENYQAQLRDFIANGGWQNIQQLAQIIYGGVMPSSKTNGTYTAPGTTNLQDLATVGGTASAIASIGGL